mmetsp:Transcript_22994/g.71057  ORF Transcript_22994/g.71057 Transcript_22994/m.71057 type:complete len:213 (-) Transcript_22994:517-1155(-)
MQHHHACGAACALEALAHAANCRRAGQEDKCVALAAAQRLKHRRGYRVLDRATLLGAGRLPRVLDAHRVALPLAGHHRRGTLATERGALAQQCRHALRLGPQRCRHDHQPQALRPEQLLRLQAQRQAQIGVQRALMELVKNHARHALQRRIRQKPPCQHALGHHLDARPLRHLAVEAHRVAHSLANLFAQHFATSARNAYHACSFTRQHEQG